jgi:hypothetical protein
MIRPFVVLALPRSRTAWLAQYLSYAGWACGHDEIRHMRSMEDVASWFAQPFTGTVETAAAPWWRFLRGRDVRIATVRRPVAECADSLMRLGLGFNHARLLAVLAKADRKIDQIEARLPGVLRVTFGELRTEDGCARLFEHCLPFQHDHGWWATMAPLNVQCNAAALLRYFLANAPQLARLADVARIQTIAAMEAQRTYTLDGFTFQQERFDQFYADGEPLFQRHLASLGQEPMGYQAHNIPLLRLMDQMGALHITTARSNGRMFAYLMATVGPSLDCPDLVAREAHAYADRRVPGLGMRLHRESRAALKARGVAEIFYQAGEAMPRMAAIYRRLGAQAHSQQYRVRI